MNSSQEDLFFDQSRSLCLDAFGSSLLEIEREKFQPQHVPTYHHFSSSDLSIEVSISLHDSNNEKQFLYELKPSTYPEKVSLIVSRARSVSFPPPFAALLLSTKLSVPTSNEFPISAHFLQQLTGHTSHAIIVFGAADGSIFALPTTEPAKIMRIFHFPSLSPVSDLSMLYCIPSPELDIVDGDIDECLVAITSGELLAACYLNADQERQVAYFRLPPHFPPSRLSCTPFGSWLHILAAIDGSLLSLSFSHTGRKEVICTPAIYPHKPGRRVPPYVPRDLDVTPREAAAVDLSITRSADDLNRALRWRHLDIMEMVRLSGGQLGAVHRETGERLVLTDYISKYEVAETEVDSLEMQSVETIRADIIFHRLYRAIVEAVFKGPDSDSPSPLHTTVELCALEDLPGFHVSEYPMGSALALVTKIAIVTPIPDIASLPLDEWTDFKILPPSTLLYLLLGELGSFRPSFIAQLSRLRDCLSVLIEVRPLGIATDLAHINIEKWAAFSLIDHIRHATCPLPASLFDGGSSFKAAISVYLELTPSDSLIPTPLRRNLYHQTTTALDLLRPQIFTTASPFGERFILPVRIPRPTELMPRFKDLFRSHGFFKHDENAQSFRYLTLRPEVEVLLETQDTGFKIASSNLGAVWSLYEAFQHYIKQFAQDECEPVSACDLRQEIAIMDALEMQLTKNQGPLELRVLLDIYAYLRNCVEIAEVNVPVLCEAVWKSQVSHRVLQKVNVEIVELLERVLSVHPLNSASLESFAEAKFISFTQSSSQWRLLFVQMLITLRGNDMLAPLRNRLLSSTVTISAFNLEVLLNLISTVAVCCKGGTLLISDMLYDLLVHIFSSTRLPEAKTTSPKKSPNLVALLDDSFSSSQESLSAVIDPLDWRFCQLQHALLLARQLATEDSRVTSFYYAQWWRERFSTPPHQTGVLATRRSLEFLATTLLRLLPHEMSAVYLHAQLTAASPFWLAASDPQEDCFRAWKEYMEVGRDRLAELRGIGTTSKSDADADAIAVSNVWSDEVSGLVKEFTGIIMETSSTPKIPTSVVEMHLFRGHYLHEVVMPMLRSPPPTLPADQRAACAALLRCIEARFGSGTSSGTTIEKRSRNVRVGRLGGKKTKK